MLQQGPTSHVPRLLAQSSVQVNWRRVLDVNCCVHVGGERPFLACVHFVPKPPTDHCFMLSVFLIISTFRRGKRYVWGSDITPDISAQGHTLLL